MTETSPDAELVSAYARQGSENAFRSLVRRHVNLVFATALRQTGNAALAEEITQNVFISLARKAPRLGGMETLAGWLHRATVLETKARIRSELRRRQREQTAFEMLNLEREGNSPLAALLPLLDEALLNLRARDRLALVLRFLEERSLREVGAALGVDEDAARKRVSRALERVGEFFRRRGFAAASASTSAVFASAVHASPASLAAACSNAALSAALGGGAVNSIIFHLMKLTLTQTAAACVLLVSAPLAWQHFQQTVIAGEQAAVKAQALQTARQAETIEAETARVSEIAQRARADSATSTDELHRIEAQLAGTVNRPHYHWDDQSPYVRVAKSSFHDGRGLAAVETRRGKLSQQIKDVLQMTGIEAAQTENAVKQFASQYDSVEARTMRQVPPEPDDLQGHAADQTRVFDVPYIGSNQMSQLRQDFFSQVTSILGDDRAEIFTNALSLWMPVREDYVGICSGQAVFNSSFRARFYRLPSNSKTLQMSIVATHNSMWVNVAADDVPDLFQPYLRDWLSAAQFTTP